MPWGRKRYSSPHGDMLDWKLLSKNFPKVAKMKTPAAARRIKLTAKKVKKTITKKSLKNCIAPLAGVGVNSTSAPSERGSGMITSTKMICKEKKSSLQKKVQEKDIMNLEVEQHIRK